MKTRALATQRGSTRRGFTLVELLVVITIIGVLAGLALVAIPAAVSRVREGAITMELAQIETALKLFQQDHGAYPPDFNAVYYPTATDRQNKLLSFMRKMSPRILTGPNGDVLTTYDPGNTSQLQAIKNLEQAGCVSPNAALGTIKNGVLEIEQIGPAEAIVLFLRGFSTDVERPLTGSGDRKPYFDFKLERLQDRDNDGWLEYYPSGIDNAPYVYFNSNSYVTGAGAVASFPLVPSTSAFPNMGQARPYYQFLGSASGFSNPETFQILCSGIDGHFGDFDSYSTTGDSVVKVYPAGLAGGSLPTPLTSIGYKTDDRDNITNFAQGPLRNKEPE